MPSGPIRLLLVEDSPVALAVLQRMLRGLPDMEVVGVARNGQEALGLIPTLKPTLICTDLHMPKMNGLALTQEVMARFPCPILVVSASVREEDRQTVFELLEAGALDIFPKPRAGLSADYDKARAELLAKIRVLAGVSVFTHRRRSGPGAVQETVALPAVPAALAPRLLALGASTGGPQALLSILQPLPRSFPAPILCVQHISDGFLQGLVNWLDGCCSLRVAIAAPGDRPQPGVVYFPPERHHLEVGPQGQLLTTQGPPVAGHCPSVTVLLKSVAAVYGAAAVGMLLTGMGRDGADGLLALAQA
jgi:two-component system chemotaxis response regulator CheB